MNRTELQLAHYLLDGYSMRVIAKVFGVSEAKLKIVYITETRGR